MEARENRPKIKISLTLADWIIEIGGFAFLLFLIALPIIFLKDMPERIPIHFNSGGVPDGYGSRSTIWLLPIIGTLVYLLLTVLSFFPQIYNFPVKITTDNILVQYRLATRLMRILKSVILMTFAFILLQTIKTVKGNAAGLGKSFLPIFLIITFGVIVFYIIQSLNNREQS
jgi:uncharacterized membrane protein